MYSDNLMMGQLQRLSDGIWTVEVLVDEDGFLKVWVSALDGGSPRIICESKSDISPDDDRSWASAFYY